MSAEFESHLASDKSFNRQITIAAAGSLLFIVIMPLLSGWKTSSITYHWAYLKFFSFQIAVSIAWAAIFLSRPGRMEDVFSAAGIGFPIALFVAWAGLSVAWSSHPWAATQPIVELGYLALAILGFANLFRRSRTRRAFLAAYASAGGVALFLYTIICFFSMDRMKVFPFANPNVAAAFSLVPLAAGASFVLAALRRNVRPRIGIFGFIVTAISLAALVTTKSAAGMIAALSGVILLLIFTLPRRPRRIVVETIAVVAILILLWPVLASEFWPGEWISGHFGARPAMWQGAWKLAAEKPIAGHGLGSFFVEYSRFYPREYATHPYYSPVLENAHSVPLNLVVELGLVGLALALWIVISAFANAARAAREADGFDRALVAGLACGILAMLAQALVSNELHQVECAVNLALALALIGGIGHGNWVRVAPIIRRFAWLRIVLAGAVAALFILTGVRGLLGEVFMHRGYVDSLATPDRIRALERSIAVSWTSETILRARVELVRLYYTSGYLESAYAEIRHADKLAPNLGKVRLFRAAIALDLNNLDDAVESIVSYTRKDPFDKQAYELWLKIAAQAARMGQPERGRAEEAGRLLSLIDEHETPRLTRDEARNLRRAFLEYIRKNGATPPA